MKNPKKERKKVRKSNLSHRSTPPSLFLNFAEEEEEARERRRRRRRRRMCGIFAYLNYNVNKERRYILQVLFNGLRRLEYRGYDSAGIAIDSNSSDPIPSSSSSSVSQPPLVFRREGNIESLVKSVYQGPFSLCLFFTFCVLIDFDALFNFREFCLIFN